MGYGVCAVRLCVISFSQTKNVVHVCVSVCVIVGVNRPQNTHNVAKHPAMAALWPTLVVMGFQEPPRPPERAFSDYPTHIAHLHA